MIVGTVLFDFSSAIDIIDHSLLLEKLSKARVSIDNSTLYTSATTATEMTETLNKELQLVSEWVGRLMRRLTAPWSHDVCSTAHEVAPIRHYDAVVSHQLIHTVQDTQGVQVAVSLLISLPPAQKTQSKTHFYRELIQTVLFVFGALDVLINLHEGYWLCIK